MSFEPRIAVGLRALHCALAAKSGQLKDKHRMGLLEAVMFHCRDDDVLCDAVLAFVGDSRAHQLEAGQIFLDFVTSTGVEMSFTAQQLELTFETIEGECVEHYKNAGGANG